MNKITYALARQVENVAPVRISRMQDFIKYQDLYREIDNRLVKANKPFGSLYKQSDIKAIKRQVLK